MCWLWFTLVQAFELFVKHLPTFTIFTFFVLIIASSLFAETEGEKLFKSNNPGAAIELLEKDIENQNISSDTYNYLGLAYFQIGEYDKAVEVFEKGQKNVTSGRKLLYFNKGK